MGAYLQKSVERLVEDHEVTAASLLQRRGPNAMIAVVVGALVGVGIAFALGVGGLIMGALAGLGAGLGQLPFVQYWVVARVDGGVVLCRSSPWFGKATELTHRSATVERTSEGALADTYETTVGQLMGSRFRRAEIDRIIGPAA